MSSPMMISPIKPEQIQSHISLGTEGATKTAYDALCASYHAIEGFRGKLLGFLPLASGGLFLFAKESDGGVPGGPFPIAFGIFGFLIALGLFIFEIYGIRRCTHLIILGRHLERRLGVEGQFRNRPGGLSRSSRGHLLRFINEPLASGVIYPAVGAAWLYLAFYTDNRLLAVLLALATFVVGFSASYAYNRWLADVDFPQAEHRLLDAEALCELAARMGKAEKSRDAARLPLPATAPNKELIALNEETQAGLEMYEMLFGKPETKPLIGLREFTIKHLFAHIWSKSRPPIDEARMISLRERSMITVSLIAAQGRSEELESHIRGALHQGISKEQVVEIMIHVAHYAGWAAGHNGQRVAMKIFDWQTDS